MSLEQAINENTVALRDLLAAIKSGAPLAAPTGTAPAADKPKADAAAKTADVKAEVKKPAAQSSGTTKESAASAASSGTGESSGEQVTYDGHVKPKILTLAKEKGRPPVEALLSRYGVTKGTDLKPEQYAEFVIDADRVLSGEYDPMAAELA